MRFGFVDLVLAVAVLSEPCPAADEPAVVSPAHGDEQGFLVHTVQSEYQAGPTKIRVLLPDQLEQGKRYPVLYVLPVESKDGSRYGDGLFECKKHDLHNRHTLICVAPTFSDLPWYADHPTNSNIRQETYFVKVVVPFVEKTYPVLAQPDGRLLVGFSKSGWGAFILLLRHPDIFGKAAAWDAPLMMEQPNRFGMGPIFGTHENFERYQISGLLKEKVSELRGVPRLIHFGYGNFRDHHESTRALMDELGIAHQYRDGPKREHDWHSGWLPEAVEMLVGNGP